MSDQGAMATRVFHVPMPLVRATLSDQALADLMELARANAPDPSIFNDAPPFFVRTIISNNSLDSYFTRMHSTSLRNYAADAEAGVSVLTNHNSRQLGFGRSITGKYTAAGGNGVARVESDFYTIPGLQLGDMPSDQIIRGIRSGIAKDTSIGFYGGRFECGLCKLDYFSWDCPHVAGMDYTFEDQQATAFAWVIESHLSEYSIVYDGATPGSEVIAFKAQQEADGGRLQPETARALDARFGVRVRGADHLWSGVALTQPLITTFGTGEAVTLTTTGRGVALNDQTIERTEQPATSAPEREEGKMSPEEIVRALNERLMVAGLHKQGEDTLACVDRLIGDSKRTVAAEAEIERLRPFEAEATRLIPLADDGRAYRSDLVTAALAEGVRAHGETFAAETYRGVLEKAEIEVIKRMRDDWKTAGDKRFPGGRMTVEGDETEQKPAAPVGRGRGVPDAAFAG